MIAPTLRPRPYVHRAVDVSVEALVPPPNVTFMTGAYRAVGNFTRNLPAVRVMATRTPVRVGVVSGAALALFFLGGLSFFGSDETVQEPNARFGAPPATPYRGTWESDGSDWTPEAPREPSTAEIARIAEPRAADEHAAREDGATLVKPRAQRPTTPASLSDRVLHRIARAEQALAAGRVAFAEKQLRAALRAAPDSADVHRRLARVALRRGRLNDALGLAEQAVELERSPESLLVLGDVREVLGDEVAARKAFQAASELDSDGREAQLRLSRFVR